MVFLGHQYVRGHKYWRAGIRWIVILEQASALVTNGHRGLLC